MIDLPTYILAGGRSQRFGSDKARALIHGIPLIVHVANQWKTICPSPTVVADRDGKYEDLGLRTIADQTPFLGPLSGLERVLSESYDTPWIFLVPCDFLGVNPEWAITLSSNRSPHAQAIIFAGEERWEPLCAMYQTSLLPWVKNHLARDQRSLWRLLKEINTLTLPLPTDWEAASKINTRQDLTRYIQLR